MSSLTDQQIDAVIAAWAMAASTRHPSSAIERYIQIERRRMRALLAAIVLPKPKIRIAMLGLKPLSKSAKAVMDLFVQYLVDTREPGVGAHQRISNSEVYLPAVIERIDEDRYSVAHYIEQNGDQIADPDIEFILEDGEWYPSASTLVLRSYRQAIVREDGQVRYNRKEYASLRALAEVLLKNIKEQQDLETGKNAPPLKQQVLVKRAFKRGREAYAAGLRSIPAHDPELTTLIDELGDKTVGKSIPLLRAWSKGWHAANLEAPVPQPDRSTEDLIQEELIPRIEAHPAFGVMRGKADRGEAHTLFEKITRETLVTLADENDDFRALREQFFDDPGYRVALVDKLFEQMYSCPIVLPTKAEAEERSLREEFRERVIAMIQQQGGEAFLDSDHDDRYPGLRTVAADLKIPRDKMVEWLFKDPYIRFNDRSQAFYLRPPAPGGGPPPSWADYEDLWENGKSQKFWRCNSCAASIPGDQDPHNLVHNTFCIHGPVQFPAHKIPRVNKLLHDLNRKAAKLGVGGGLTMKVVREFPYKLHVGEHEGREDRYDCSPQTRPSHWPDVPHVEVEFAGEVPKMPGFDVLGVIEHPSEEDRFAGITANIIRELPGRSVPARFRTATNACEHCKLARNRLETVVLRDEAGRVLQVGRSCLADYVGTADAESRVRAFLNFQDFWASIRELVEGKGSIDEAWSELNEGEGKPPRVLTLERFLTWVAACVREDKAFVSAKMTGERYKQTSGECAYDAGMGELDKPAKARERLQPEDVEAGEAAAAWAKENLRVEDAKSNFDSNLAAIVARGYVKSDTMNMASWIFRKWQDATNPRVPKDSQGQRKVNDWRPEAIGAVVDMRLTLVRLKRNVGQTYNSDLYVFEDEEGRSIVLFTSAKDGPEVGDVVEIKAEIRGKDTRNNIKQTKVGKKGRGWLYISKVPRPDVPGMPEAASPEHFVTMLQPILEHDSELRAELDKSTEEAIDVTMLRRSIEDGVYRAERQLEGDPPNPNVVETYVKFDGDKEYRQIVVKLLGPVLIKALPLTKAETAGGDSVKGFLAKFGAQLLKDSRLASALARDDMAQARTELLAALSRLQDEFSRKAMGPLSVKVGEFLNYMERDSEMRNIVVTRLKTRLSHKPVEPMPRRRTYA